MITIHVRVVLPSEGTREIELPLNTDIDKLYARLVTLENLPSTTGRGEAIAYGFYHRRGKMYLPAHESLVDADIQNGDVIDVVPWPTDEPPIRALQQVRPAGARALPNLSRRRVAWVVVVFVAIVALGLLLLSNMGGQAPPAAQTATASPAPPSLTAEPSASETSTASQTAMPASDTPSPTLSRTPTHTRTPTRTRTPSLTRVVLSPTANATP